MSDKQLKGEPHINHDKRWYNNLNHFTVYIIKVWFTVSHYFQVHSENLCISVFPFTKLLRYNWRKETWETCRTLMEYQTREEYSTFRSLKHFTNFTPFLNLFLHGSSSCKKLMTMIWLGIKFYILQLLTDRRIVHLWVVMIGLLQNEVSIMLQLVTDSQKLACRSQCHYSSEIN